jgi:hypothetical protein
MITVRSLLQLLRHTASSDLLTHALLMSEPTPDKLVFSTMDVLFIQQFGQYLFQLASTSTRVQALIRYMRETVTSLEAGFASMNDFTQKYVRIIDEDAQKIDSNVGLELFEFLVTGGPSPPLKEWLSDTLTDRVWSTMFVVLSMADLYYLHREQSNGKRILPLLMRACAGWYMKTSFLPASD